MPIRHTAPDPQVNNVSSYLYKQHVYNAAGEAGAGSGADFNRSIHGTTWNVEPQIGATVEYRGEYISGAIITYGINDLVSVNTASTYVVDGITYESPVGVYLCIDVIPTLPYSVYATLPPEVQVYLTNSIDDGTQVIYPVDPSMGYWIRMAGGGTGSFNYSKWEYSSSYSLKDVVYVSQSLSGSKAIKFWSGSTGIDSPDKNVWTYDGTYVCVKPVSGFGSRDTGSFQVPYYPYEDSSSLVYWHLISLVPSEFTVCNSENTPITYYIEGIQKEPPMSRSIQIM
jgi:hypothetical protein